jgi:hypothetical protein
MTITIVGAGMAGLLAANMLHRHSPQIIEAQTSLPNNHSAVLRFRSDKVAEVTGIPFKRVKMIKDYRPWHSPIGDALMYSSKCTGIARSDRSMPVDTIIEDRWIAPPDFISRMAKDIDIKFGQEFRCSSAPVISTIPMPSLMKLLDYPDIPPFACVEGANITAKALYCDAYVSTYVPDPSLGFNRVSITGDEVIAEYAFPRDEHKDIFNNRFLDSREEGLLQEMTQVMGVIGLQIVASETIKIHRQRYAKIQPIDDGARKKFMAWATDNHNIFSLGRYATWRPGLLLDDLVHDIRQIEKWISDPYSMKFAR